MPPHGGIGQIYFHLAKFCGPSGRTPFRGPGNTVIDKQINFWFQIQ